ncbi:MAG: hypothetical protein ACPGNT_00765 [Rhodospirillales bacterium]
MSDVALTQAQRLNVIQQQSQLRERLAREADTIISRNRQDSQDDQARLLELRQRDIQREQNIQDQRADIQNQQQRLDLQARLSDLQSTQVDTNLPRGSLVDIVA